MNEQQQQTEQQSPMPSIPVDQLPAPVQQDKSGKHNLSLWMPKSQGELVTNLRPDDEHERGLVGRAMSPVDAGLGDYLGKTIDVIGVVMNLAEFDSIEVPGETVERIYASIILEDGTVVGTTAKATIPYLSFLMGARPRREWSPPVKLEVRAHNSKRGLKYYSLREVMSAKAKPAGKGREK